MLGTYQSRINEKSRVDNSTVLHPVEIGDSAPVRRRAPPIPFTRDKGVTALLHRLQGDEEERLEEIRRNPRIHTEHNDNRRPLRQINLTSSSSHLPTITTTKKTATNYSSSLAPRYNESGKQILGHGDDRLSDAEILVLFRKIQNIDASLVDIPDASASSLYSGLNTMLLNKQSIYNKQREQRIAHHLSEIRRHVEMLLVSSPQRDLLLGLLDSDTSSSCPSPLSETT